jgi:hypothetical protein
MKAKDFSLAFLTTILENLKEDMSATPPLRFFQ